MEITLLTTAQYVDDRYKELKRKRPEDKDVDALVEDKGVELTPQARRFDALPGLDDVTAVSGSSEALEKRNLTACLHDLERMWPVTLLDKKLTVLFTILDQMATAASTSRDASSMLLDDKKSLAPPSTTSLESLPLASQLAVKLFFRLIPSIRARSQASGNYATLLRLVHQLPRMLTDLPPLALSPEQRLLTNDKSIFDEIVVTVQQVVAQTKEDQEAVLTTLVGLSIKRGRLLHILGVVRLLLQADPALPMQLALPFLQELADAKAQEAENAPDEGLSAGYLMSFGKGDHGKLGHGTCTHVTCADSKCTENKNVPTMLDGCRDLLFKKIDSLSTHSVAITVAGELYTWGNGEKFRLGHGDATKEYTPRLVEAFRDKPRVKDVACGLGHTVVLLVSGDVYAWGNGGNGRLGLGDTVDQSAPMKVSFAEKSDAWAIDAVFCGASHTLAITPQGRLYTWGKNNQGQCGHGHTNDQLTPAEVLFFDEMEFKVATVAGGWEHTLICTTEGQAFACGCGYKDSRRAGLPPVLGVGMNDTERRVKPALIPALENCVAVACGWDHSLAVTGDGSVYSWGSGSNGKLGHGDEDNRDIPTKIQGLHGKLIQDVKAGCEHTTAITSNGEMYTWGHSDSGRLGHGDNVTRKSPCFVESFAWQGYRPVAIAVGDKYNLVLVQPVAEKPSNTNNQASVTKPSKTPRTTMHSTLDESAPLTAASLTSHVMAQLDRLAGAYLPQDNTQLLDKLRQLYLHPTTSASAMAYAVDVSNETFQTLVEIVTLTLAKPDPADPSGKSPSLKSTKSSAQHDLILTSLRLIKVNLYQLLSCPSAKVTPAVLQKLYVMLRELATLPVTDESHDISQYAADALKIGFQLFYPTGVQQHELLWQLMHMTQSSDLTLLRALVDRLCQDYVIVELMARLFSKHHQCAVDGPGADAWDKDNLTSLDLMALMTRLLKQCAQVDNENPRLQLQLKMLAVLQSHLFSAWTSSYCTTCVARTLGPFLECLFGEALTLLRKVHKGLLKGNDLSKLQPSFFHVLVPLAIESIEVTHLRSNVKVGKSLLPLLLPMLKLVDEITYKMSEDSKVNNQVLPDIEWITELENVCARLVGRYVGMFVASPTSTFEPTSAPSCIQYLCRHGTMHTDPHEELLRKWEASHVYDVAHETQPPEQAPNDVTLVDHLAILDWVQGQGVLEDFHNYMLRHLEPFPATVEVIPLAIVVWHTGLLPSIFACIAAVGAVELRLTSANHPPPPDALLRVWQWVLTYCAGLDISAWETIRAQGKVLLEYYPSKCLFTADNESDIPPKACRHPNCTIQPTTQSTVSLAQVVAALSERIPRWQNIAPAGVSLKIVGLSILHDSLCKLTSNPAKCELLRVFVEPVESPGGCLSIHFNAWQEPKVDFASAGLDKLTPLHVLERDMHTQYDVLHHTKLSKAFENLYIRLAKVVASPESSLLLKKRALNLWCISFHDASLVRNSGILHTLGELLQHEANILLVAHPDMKMDDVIYTSAHGVPASLSLPPRLRPVEKLVYMATSGYNVHQACWHVFSWLCKQFMSNDDQRAVLNELRPSASSKALVCASPRKRLTLPPKLIVSTLEESIDHMYLVLLQETTKIKDALVAWNAHAGQIAPCVQDSQVMLLADPHVVSSVSTVFMATNKQRAPEIGWTICLWVHIDEYSPVPLVLVANGEPPLVQTTVTVEDQGHVGIAWSTTFKLVTTRALKRGGWTHVACNLLKDKTELYIDGVLDATLAGHFDVVMHPTFTMGGLVDPLKPEHHSSHILLDDMTVHEKPLGATEISALAAAGSLLFRIKQRQVLDQYCTSLVSLLAWLAVVKAPSMTDEIPLLLALLPLCPPQAHPHMFQLLACVLPSIAPSLPVPALSDTLLDFLVKQFGLAWFSAHNTLYGPPDFYDLLTSRKDNCIASLVRAGHLDKDGVASWLVSDGPIKTKATSILRTTRASLMGSFVALFRTLLASPMWTAELLQKFAIGNPENVLVPRRSDNLNLAYNKESVVPLILSIYVQGGFSKATAPPVKMDDSMHGLLEWVLQHPVCIDGHGSSLDMDQDIQIATYMHVRVSLLRLAAAHASSPLMAGALLQQPSVVTELLAMAIRPFKGALEGVFGTEFDIVSKLDNVRGLIDWIADDANESVAKKRGVLDTLATILFERLPYVGGADVSPWWVLSASQNLHVLGGEVEIDEYRIKGIQHFPTVKLNGVSVTAGSGMWYYEVVLLSDGLMQIGWIDSAFESDALQGQGVGDHTNSWAYDGFRRKKWNVGAMDYGEKWRSGDVVGVLLDTDRCEMQYFLNGRPLGVAFEGLRLNHPIYPAMSLNIDQSVQFHFTASQFLYLPSMEKIQPVSSAILGHVCEHSTAAAATKPTPNAQEQDARRTDLIEGLIGLGFPPEWALRCARETSMELSESGAIAWIMEQMEQEAQSVRPPPLHGFDTSTQHLQQLDGFLDVKKSSVVLEAPHLNVPDDEFESANPFLTEEFCEEAYGAELFAPHVQPPPTSPEAKPTDKSAAFVSDLAENCRDEEILPLYLIVETARSMWCAQDVVNLLIGNAQHSTSPGFPEALFLEFVQSVVGRHDDNARRLDKYTRIFHAMCATNPAFVSTLVADILRHFQVAGSKEHWYTSFRPGTCVRKPGLNLEWSCWLAQVLFSFARDNHEAQSLILGSNMWPTLMKAATSCNATLRHRAVMVMTSYLQTDFGATLAVLPTIRFDYLVDWLAAKVRKELPARVVYSDYTQSLFQLVVTLDSLLAANDAPPTAELLPPLSDLLVEHIAPSSVTFGCSLQNVSHFQLATQSVINGRVGMSSFVDLAEPAFQPGQSSYTISDLQPDTKYSIRAVVPPDEHTLPVTFETACESLLELDPSSMGANLELLNHNMSVRNRVNKKWHAVRASVSYSSGVHTWDVRIDKCVSKNIFVGICTADASMENYVGSDAWGWGFLANKAVWHNKSKLQTYGDIFKQGDVVTVTLNLDRGTLSFARNGDSFGVGVEHLPSNEAAYFPAISMYNKDDQVTFSPHEATTSTKVAKSGVASVMRMVRDVQRLHKLWDSPGLLPQSESHVYSTWVEWTLGQLKYVVGGPGDVLAVQVSDAACSPYGLSPGDVVFTTKGMCTVLGVAQHRMWYHLESHSSPMGQSGQVLASWNVQVCRDMLARPNDFPITRHHSNRQLGALPACDVAFGEFAARQSGWTPELDEALVFQLELLCQRMSIESIFELTPADVSRAFSSDGSGKVPGMSDLDCLCRVGVIHASNRLLQDVLPYVVSSSGQHSMPRARHSCVVGTKFVRDLIKKSATLTMPAAADDADDDPIDLPKFKLTLPSTPCTPCWEQRGIDSNPPTPAGLSSRLASVSGQLTAFFSVTDPRDLRRQYVAPSTSVYTTSVQPRAFRVLCDDLADPAASYLHVFRECAREVQSSLLPLFVPVATDDDSLPFTMVNPNEKDIAQYECVGKVIGMAWRCDISMPWLFGSVVWKYLTDEALTLSDWRDFPSQYLGVPNAATAVKTGLAMATWTDQDFEANKIPAFAARDGADFVRADTRSTYVDALLASLLAPYQPALDAMRAGIASIIPASCLGLLSGAQLQRQLTSPAVDLLRLEASATYSGNASATTCPEVASGLWKIVHSFSLDDQRHFCRFLLGLDGWMAASVRLDIRPCPTLTHPHGSSDDHSTASYGYPYVERTIEVDTAHPMTSVRLYVPAYASVELLQKKLHLAMTHTDQPPQQPPV